jgi:hypothetical protein
VWSNPLPWALAAFSMNNETFQMALEKQFVVFNLDRGPICIWMTAGLNGKDFFRVEGGHACFGVYFF